VRYITTQPSLTTFSALAHSEISFTDNGNPSYEFGFATGGPIVEDKLAFRISAWGREDGGWINRVNYQTLNITDPDANYVNTWNLRGALTWSPVPNLTITPGIDYQNRYQNNYDNYWVSISNAGQSNFNSGTPDKQSDPDRFYLPTLRVEYDTSKVKIISNTSYYNRLESVNGYSATLYNLSFFQHFLSADPNINQYGLNFPIDPQGNPCSGCGSFYPLLTPTGPNLPQFPNYISQNIITNSQENWTQEFRLQSPDSSSRLSWTAGLFYTHDDQRSTEEIRDPELGQISELFWGESVTDAWGVPLLPNGDDYINDTRATDTQTALFANASYLVTDKLKVTGGLRYAWTKFSYNNVNQGPQDLLDGPPTVDNGGLASGSKSEQPVTPMGSISYQITQDDMIYGTIAKGYRIGGASPPLPPNCGSGFPTQYDSDHVWSYEIGSKDRFFDRALQVQGSAFYIQWSGIQQAFYVPACGIQFTTNAGEVVSKGFDFQSSLQVTHALNVDVAVGYTNATFTGDAFDANGDLLDAKGDTLDIPPWTLTVGAQYDFNLFGAAAFARVDYSFSSQRTAPIPNEDYRTAFYDPHLVADPNTDLVNLRLGAAVKNWDLAVYVNNVFNSHPQLNLQHEDLDTTLYEATTFRPITVGLSASYKY
jgi:outer membrane receptor protein involved in Fe transport